MERDTTPTFALDSLVPRGGLLDGGDELEHAVSFGKMFLLPGCHSELLHASKVCLSGVYQTLKYSEVSAIGEEFFSLIRRPHMFDAQSRDR